MKLNDVIKVKIKGDYGVLVCARITKDQKRFIDAKRINIRMLITASLKELGYKEGE